MKKIILLASILFVSACSQNNSSAPTPPQDNTEEVFNLDANGILLMKLVKVETYLSIVVQDSTILKTVDFAITKKRYKALI